jgi:hypothetical protein
MPQYQRSHAKFLPAIVVAVIQALVNVGSGAD